MHLDLDTGAYQLLTFDVGLLGEVCTGVAVAPVPRDVFALEGRRLVLLDAVVACDPAQCRSRRREALARTGLAQSREL